jgi:L-fucose isomerase-like protein
VVTIDLDELLEIARRADRVEADKYANQIRRTATQFDESLSDGIEKSGRVSLALQELATKYDLQAVAVSCWPRFQSEYHFAVCSVMGYMNTTGLIASCEGDVPSAASMLTLHYLTGGDVVTLMDLVSVDANDESVLLWHCGPTSPALADENGVRMESLWLFDQPDQAPTGLHNDMVLRSGPGTVLGFSPEFDRMLLLEGVIDNTKPSYNGSRGWLKNLRLNTCPTNTAELVQTLMASGYQHHYPFAYGWLAEAGLELCAWLGIAPIAGIPYTHYAR